VISRTIKLTAGNEPLAARLLGLGVRTLYRRLERYASGEMRATRGATSVSRSNGSRA
jgi:DNA-binding NtrC family response regulator